MDDTPLFKAVNARRGALYKVVNEIGELQEVWIVRGQMFELPKCSKGRRSLEAFRTLSRHTARCLAHSKRPSSFIGGGRKPGV